MSDVIIKADLIRFKQLVYNLISNAVKFSKENSTISIVTFVNNKKEFTFEIKDRGDGISKKIRQKYLTFLLRSTEASLNDSKAQA